MRLTKFWNKAIEFYCTAKKPNIKESFNIIFIAVSEESLEKIKERFISNYGLSQTEIELSKRNIENVGGTIDSYYSAIKEVQNDLNNPGKYSFLRFSILVVGAFKQDDSSLKNYWKDFDPFLKGKGINLINQNSRTDYLNKLIINLSKFCYLTHEKTFFQLNIFGENSNIINVGRIKAHSVFQGKTLRNIKKSIYSLGYSDSHSIDDLSFDDIEEIIKNSGETRILNLFNRDDDAKEIVYVCLKIWLEKWSPTQEEKVQLLKGKVSLEKAPLSIIRVWAINREKSNQIVEIKFGFIYRTEIGEEGLYYLNKDENIYIDTSWGIRLSDSRILYVIENYSSSISLNHNDLGLKFKNRQIDLNEKAYALEKIPNRDYFIEHQDKRVKIKDNPILIASKNEIKDENAIYFSDFTIQNQHNLNFKLYRIIDSFEYSFLSFIKTNSLNIFPIGISDGTSSTKSYLSSFPIKINYNNITKGEIHLLENDNIIKKTSLNKIIDKLDTEVNIGCLSPGNYKIKYLDDNKYLNFQNGQDFIPFTIVDAGTKDRRIELKSETVNTFNYHEFRGFKTFESPEDSYIVLQNNDEDLYFKENHTDFYFFKSNRDDWIVRPNKDVSYLQRTLFNPFKNELNYSKWEIEMTYLSTQFLQYHYKIKFCERPNSLRLPFDINDFYQKNDSNRITNDFINADCYYYKLVEMDDQLMEKYPNVAIGDEIYVFSNKRENRNPENLLKLVNQEFFPFKK